MARTETTETKYAVGTVVTEIGVENLSRTQIVQYAGASGDYNPIHTDEPFAVEVKGLPTVLGHGMLTMGITSRVVTRFVGDAKLRSFGGRFVERVWPGDTLTVALTVTDLRDETGEQVVELEVTTTNQHDAPVFRGTAVALAT